MLREDAAAWWYHRECRESGDPVKRAEGRKRERESILSTCEALREMRANGGFVRVALGGGRWTFERAKGATTTGYGGMDSLDVRAALRYGIPVVDATEADDGAYSELIVRGPMAGALRKPDRLCCGLGRCVGATPCKVAHDDGDFSSFRSLDGVPFALWAPHAVAAGAKVYNFPVTR